MEVSGERAEGECKDPGRGKLGIFEKQERRQGWSQMSKQLEEMARVQIMGAW